MPASYDKNTIDRLRFIHGDRRASDIVIGRDQRTNADLAAWRRLGGRTPTTLDERFDLAFKLIHQGYTVEDAAFMSDIRESSLRMALKRLEQ